MATSKTVIFTVRIFQWVAIALLPLLMAGCATPSKLYTTDDPQLLEEQSPTPCDTFNFGDHPVVVVEGFPTINDAILEVLTDGNLLSRKHISLNTGHVEHSDIKSTMVYSGLTSQYVQQNQVSVAVNYGDKVDLGPVAPGTYNLKLLTNDVLAATASFTVTEPDWLKKRRLEIESSRSGLQQTKDQLDQLRAEIEKEQPTINTSDVNQVTAFNAKAKDYNNRLQQFQTDQLQFNSKVQDYNQTMKNPQTEPTFDGTNFPVIFPNQ